MALKNKPSRDRVARLEQKQREAGRVQRKRWAHPDDWPEIDRFIYGVNKLRIEEEKKMKYQGADIQESDGSWWIIHDNGKSGPFKSYDAAANEANIDDNDLMEEYM